MGPPHSAPKRALPEASTQLFFLNGESPLAIIHDSVLHAHNAGSNSFLATEGNRCRGREINEWRQEVGFGYSGSSHFLNDFRENIETDVVIVIVHNSCFSRLAIPRRPLNCDPSRALYIDSSAEQPSPNFPFLARRLPAIVLRLSPSPPTNGDNQWHKPHRESGSQSEAKTHAPCCVFLHCSKRHYVAKTFL